MTVVAVMISEPLGAVPRPQDISQLKSLEQKVTGVVQKVLPATISLFSMKNGASGSGVVVSKDGLILTAGHVVRGSDEMTVIFPNGKQAQAKS
jgi:serine protease Do